MSDATGRILLGRKRLVDAYTQQHESDAEAARAYAEDILRSDPLALTVAEAARRLSVSVSTIRAMIADKRLPCVRLVGRKGSRGRVLVRTADVDALLCAPALTRPAVATPILCSPAHSQGHARRRRRSCRCVRVARSRRGGAMTERIPTPLAAKRLVYKGEELRRKRQGTWDATTMVSVTSPEGAALRASQLASPEKVADAQPIAIEPRKNETLPNFKAACKFTTEKPRGDDEDDAGLVEIPAGDHSPPHEPTSLPTPLTTTVENRTAKAERCCPPRRS